MMTTMEVANSQLERIASKARKEIVRMSFESKSPHLGSSLSVVDILIAAYWYGLDVDPENPYGEGRDRLIFSKGHAAAALYAVLALRGLFSLDLLDSYAREDTLLGEHPIANALPGLEVATGSLGHGLPMGVGVALANKIKNYNAKTIVVMSDGECNEGSVWEAAMFAPAHDLENLMVVIDFNKWQATGRSREVLSLDSLAEKWEAFGWSTYEVNGHDMTELADAMSYFPDNSCKPIAIIAHTIKGKGVSFMEDDNNWHYRIPTEDEVGKAILELTI